MSLRRTVALALAITLGVSVGPHTASAVPATLNEQTEAYRAALEQAVAEYQAAQTAAADLDSRMAAASAEFDSIVVEQQHRQSVLQARAVSMYRTGDYPTIALLFRASSVAELAVRLDMLDLLARQDAQNIEALKSARAEAQRQAEELLQLQAEQAAALDALAQKVEHAKQDLAGSEAALREYEARVAAAAAAAAAARKAKAPAQGAPDQQLAGTGEWGTAVASHYGRNFTGRGASGEQIGPYSMIVAHRTLPFGTLIEFEYKGKRCVARVADRGPHIEGREFDLGPGVARVLDFNGVHEVRYRII